MEKAEDKLIAHDVMFKGTQEGLATLQKQSTRNAGMLIVSLLTLIGLLIVEIVKH